MAPITFRTTLDRPLHYGSFSSRLSYFPDVPSYSDLIATVREQWRLGKSTKIRLAWVDTGDDEVALSNQDDFDVYITINAKSSYGDHSRYPPPRLSIICDDSAGDSDSATSFSTSRRPKYSSSMNVFFKTTLDRPFKNRILRTSNGPYQTHIHGFYAFPSYSDLVAIVRKRWRLDRSTDFRFVWVDKLGDEVTLQNQADFDIYERIVKNNTISSSSSSTYLRIHVIQDDPADAPASTSTPSTSLLPADGLGHASTVLAKPAGAAPPPTPLDLASTVLANAASPPQGTLLSAPPPTSFGLGSTALAKAASPPQEGGKESAAPPLTSLGPASTVLAKAAGPRQEGGNESTAPTLTSLGPASTVLAKAAGPRQEGGKESAAPPPTTLGPASTVLAKAADPHQDGAKESAAPPPTTLGPASTVLAKAACTCQGGAKESAAPPPTTLGPASTVAAAPRQEGGKESVAPPPTSLGPASTVLAKAAGPRQGGGKESAGDTFDTSASWRDDDFGSAKSSSTVQEPVDANTPVRAAEVDDPPEVLPDPPANAAEGSQRPRPGAGTGTSGSSGPQGLGNLFESLRGNMARVQGTLNDLRDNLSIRLLHPDPAGEPELWDSVDAIREAAQDIASQAIDALGSVSAVEVEMARSLFTDDQARSSQTTSASPSTRQAPSCSDVADDLVDKIAQAASQASSEAIRSLFESFHDGLRLTAPSKKTDPTAVLVEKPGPKVSGTSFGIATVEDGEDSCDGAPPQKVPKTKSAETEHMETREEAIPDREPPAEDPFRSGRHPSTRPHYRHRHGTPWLRRRSTTHGPPFGGLRMDWERGLRPMGRMAAGPSFPFHSSLHGTWGPPPRPHTFVPPPPCSPPAPSAAPPASHPPVPAAPPPPGPPPLNFRSNFSYGDLAWATPSQFAPPFPRDHYSVPSFDGSPFPSGADKRGPSQIAPAEEADGPVDERDDGNDRTARRTSEDSSLSGGYVKLNDGDGEEQDEDVEMAIEEDNHQSPLSNTIFVGGAPLDDGDAPAAERLNQVREQAEANVAAQRAFTEFERENRHEFSMSREERDPFNPLQFGRGRGRGPRRGGWRRGGGPAGRGRGSAYRPRRWSWGDFGGGFGDEEEEHHFFGTGADRDGESLADAGQRRGNPFAAPHRGPSHRRHHPHRYHNHWHGHGHQPHSSGFKAGVGRGGAFGDMGDWSRRFGDTFGFLGGDSASGGLGSSRRFDRSDPLAGFFDRWFGPDGERVGNWGQTRWKDEAASSSSDEEMSRAIGGDEEKASPPGSFPSAEKVVDEFKDDSSRVKERKQTEEADASLSTIAQSQLGRPSDKTLPPFDELRAAVQAFVDAVATTTPATEGPDAVKPTGEGNSHRDVPQESREASDQSDQHRSTAAHGMQPGPSDSEFPVRIWMDSTGRYSYLASYVPSRAAENAGKVRLRRAGGADDAADVSEPGLGYRHPSASSVSAAHKGLLIDVPLEKLCLEDREWVRRQKEGKGTEEQVAATSDVPVSERPAAGTRYAAAQTEKDEDAQKGSDGTQGHGSRRGEGTAPWALFVTPTSAHHSNRPTPPAPLSRQVASDYGPSGSRGTTTTKDRLMSRLVEMGFVDRLGGTIDVASVVSQAVERTKGKGRESDGAVEEERLLGRLVEELMGMAAAREMAEVYGRVGKQGPSVGYARRGMGMPGEWWHS